MLLDLFANRRPTDYSARLGLNKFEKWLVDISDDVELPLPRPLGNVGKDDWLVRFRRGTFRPRWMGKIVSPMKPAVGNDDAEERIRAAVILSAFGEDEIALPVLMNEPPRSRNRGLPRPKTVDASTCREGSHLELPRRPRHSYAKTR